MAQTQWETYPIHSLDGGMVSSVSSRKLDQSMGFSQMFKNLNQTFPGLPRKRPACIPFRDTPAPATGIHQFVKLSTGDTFLMVSYGEVVDYLDGTNWVEVVDGLSVNVPVEFLTIADQVVITNGENNLMLWNGVDPVVTDVGERYATARTYLIYANNDLRFTARAPGEAFIKVMYEKAVAATPHTTVDVAGSGTEDDYYLILVRLAWHEVDSEDVILSTAVDVKDAIEATSAANTLIEVEHTPDSDGSREVLEMPETVLVGGFDAVVGKYLTEYRLRAVVADGSMIRLSHTGDPTLWSPYAAGSNAVSAYVSPDDGENISGLLNMGDGGILIGKPSSIYGLFGYKRDNFVIDKLDPSVGVSSHKSMVFARPNGYFVGNKGVYRVVPGGTPERISYPIEELFNSLTDLDRLDESTAFLYERMYVLCTPGKSGWVILSYHVDRETWGLWDNPSGIVASAVNKDREVYYSIEGFNQLISLDADELVDFPGETDYELDITAEIKTIELDVDQPHVEKDIGDLYVVFRAESEDYLIGVSVYADGEEEPVVSVKDIPITGTQGKQKVVRVPVGKTLRFMEIKVFSDSAEPFTPMAAYYTHQVKAVL